MELLSDMLQAVNVNDSAVRFLTVLSVVDIPKGIPPCLSSFLLKDSVIIRIFLGLG